MPHQYNNRDVHSDEKKGALVSADDVYRRLWRVDPW